MLVNVKNFGGTFELHDAWIIDFTHNTLDQSAYTEMTIAQARNAAKGAKVCVTGVVARITFANGYVPSGVMLVDDTGSIYIYDRNVAAACSIGNTITVKADKTYWILEKSR